MKWKKEEELHLRDKHGNPIKPYRTGDIKQPKTLSKEELEEKEKRERKKLEKAHLKKITKEYKQREAERKAMERANRKKQTQKKWAPVKTALKTSVNTSKQTMGATRQTMNLGKMSFDSKKKRPTKNTGQKYIIRNNIAYPIAQKKKTKKKKKKEGDFNWKDFGMPSWKDMMK